MTGANSEGDTMPKRKLFLKKGQRFGHWTVLEESHKDKWRRVLYLVECKCGTIKKVAGYELSKGKTDSCHACSMKTYKEQRYLLKIKQKEDSQKEKQAQYFIGS